MKTAMLVAMAMVALAAWSCTAGPDKRTDAKQPADQHAPGLVITPAPDGLATLQFNGEQLLKNGRFTLREVQLSNYEGDVVLADLQGGKVDMDPQTNTVTQTYPWGSAQCRYTVQGNRLALTVTVTNSSDRIIRSALLQVLELQFPQAIKGYDGGWRKGHNKDAPSVVGIDYASGTLALVDEQLARPLYLGIARPAGVPKEKKTDFVPDESKQGYKASDTYPIILCNARHGAFYNKWMEDPNIDRPIYPGKSDTYTISLRFGPAGTSVGTLAADIYQKFAAAYPQTLQWADRRPIGALFLANSAMHYPTNPRGWFNDKNLDVNTDEGRAKFKELLLAFADRSIKVLKDSNCQGAIIWDLEGGEYPHAITYLGDPRSLPPEMDAVADAFLKKFTDAGLRVGLTTRPQQPVRPAYGNAVNQQGVADEWYTLEQKIAYAKKRWNCTLFYVDSNTGVEPLGRYDDEEAYYLYNVEGFKKVVKAHPDVLVIPEMGNFRYYAYTAPFRSFMHRQITSTAPEIRRAYPNAFAVLYVGDYPFGTYYDALRDAVKQGDILLINAWFENAATRDTKKLYQEIGSPTSAPATQPTPTK